MSDFLNEISGFRRFQKNGVRSVHKPAFLLAIVKLYEENPAIPNKFQITDELEKKFVHYFNVLSNTKQTHIAIEYPFVHLQSEGYWTLKFKHGHENIAQVLKENKQRFTKNKIVEHIEYAYLRSDFDAFLRNKQTRTLVMEKILSLFNSDSYIEKPSPFVQYLNKMQRIQGDNAGALAEFQSQEPHFSLIEEEHPLCHRIYEHLKNGENVILTGHAGDGKSTIAVNIFKQLSGLEQHQALTEPIRPIEKIRDTNIVLIKDLSEQQNAPQLLNKILEGKSNYLLVSNTGALLDMLKEHSSGNDELEAEALTAIQQEYAELPYGSTVFHIYNLANIDNLVLSRKVFTKILDPQNWEHCKQCSCNQNCQILKNREFLVANEYRAVDRIFFVYRRLAHYGCRLTMRQLMEHLSYSLTGGKERGDIENQLKKVYPNFSNLSFLNLFWGNNGQEEYSEARQIHAIELLRKEQIGKFLSAKLERQLWSTSSLLPRFDFDDSWTKQLNDLKGRALKTTRKLSCAQARAQIRRAVYFLARLADNEDSIDSFLDSVYTRKWEQWSKSPSDLNGIIKSRLSEKIFSVLQEQFSGQQSDDWQHGGNHRLLLSQHRNIIGMRQSVQMLLATLDIKDDFDELQWKRKNTLCDESPCYILKLTARSENSPSLELDVPFLDYVQARYCGELSESLSAAYQQRLENFKAALLPSQNTQEIRLARMMADKSTSIYTYAVRKSADKVELVVSR